VLERFAYYGIYFGFGICTEHLGYRAGSWDRQSIFCSCLPIRAGDLADCLIQKVLIVASWRICRRCSCCSRPSHSSGIVLTMLDRSRGRHLRRSSRAGARGPTVTRRWASASLRDGQHRRTFGPDRGRTCARSRGLRVRGCRHRGGDHALVTIFFCKEPPRIAEGTTLKQKFKEMGARPLRREVRGLLIPLGFFFWLPFWPFSTSAVYVDSNPDTAKLYLISSRWWGAGGELLSHETSTVSGAFCETIGKYGWIIMVLQIIVSRTVELARCRRFFGCSSGRSVFAIIGFAKLGAVFGATRHLPSLGEMMASPRIRSITWIAPREGGPLTWGLP
jgi:hypothetical protein